MPLYEYFCEPCNGIFEELRPMRESSDPVPCPECYKDAPRIMPTSFTAFTFREGYPRRIPDDGKYYHLGKKVSSLVTGGAPNEHPEINKKEPGPVLSKADKTDLRDAVELAKKDELVDAYGSRVAPENVVQAATSGRGLKKGTPGL